MATVHMECRKEDVAKIVLMTGDPRRTKFIAENYLTNPKIINKVRGMIAYTGEYKNKRITIFPSGMGIPSMGIYSYELFKYYDVDCIIRIGTLGAYDPKLKLGDVIVSDKVYTDSTYAKVQNNYEKEYTYPNKEVNKLILETAKELNIPCINGAIFTSDVFYEPAGKYIERREKYQVLGTEMETFGLFHTARMLNKKASTILTVSNSFCFEKEYTSEEREKKLHDAITLALNTSLKL